MNANRRKFCISLGTGAAFIGAAVAIRTEDKPKVIEAGYAKASDPWPMRMLEIEGRDGKVHLIPAWS